MGNILDGWVIVYYSPIREHKNRNRKYIDKEARLRLPPINAETGLRLRYSNGCKLHSNCFSCPFDDCIVGYAPMNK